MHTLGEIITYISIILAWRMIVKNRQQIDYIHLICAIIFTISLIYLSSDFGYQPINLVPFIIPALAAAIGLYHKPINQLKGTAALSKKQIVLIILAVVLLGNPVTLGLIFVLLNCGLLVAGPNADKLYCQIAEFGFMFSSLYSPAIVVIGLIVTLVVIIRKNITKNPKSVRNN